MKFATLSAMARGRNALAAATVMAGIAIVLGLGASAGGGQDGPWPDSHVAALWPTFAAIPAPRSGWGGPSAWNGSFARCIQSPRVTSDYACEYADAQGRRGYVCVSPATNAAISQTSIDARVAPGDPTYSGEDPAKVCYSALAYTLSLG